MSTPASYSTYDDYKRLREATPVKWSSASDACASGGEALGVRSVKGASTQIMRVANTLEVASAVVRDTVDDSEALSQAACSLLYSVKLAEKVLSRGYALPKYAEGQTLTSAGRLQLALVAMQDADRALKGLIDAQLQVRDTITRAKDHVSALTTASDNVEKAFSEDHKPLEFPDYDDAQNALADRIDAVLKIQ